MNSSSAPGSELRQERAEEPELEKAELELLAARDVARVRAANPGPLTLSGTNTWIVGRDPAWVVDPGPALASHRDAVLAAVQERGGLGGIVLTHDHGDHAEGARELRGRSGATLAAARGSIDVVLADGASVGPFTAVSTPGHAADHFALIAAGACFTGDAVLGAGSVFISPHPGAMAGYLRALRALRARADFDLLCPGHGPLVLDAHARLGEYIAHRSERETRLVAALHGGLRSTQDLLDAVWAEVPQELRPAAAATLAAHLDKLEEDGVLPEGVQRPSFAGVRW